MLNRLRHRLCAVLRRDRVEAELNEELRYHLDREVERLVAEGMPRDQAALMAARVFGNVESLKEESRDAWGTRAWNDLVADVRYAARGLRRSPSLTLSAVLTLAMGIGGSTAIFSLVDTVLLKTLPVEAPEELSFLEVKAAQGSFFGAPPYPALEGIRDDSRSFTGLAAYAQDQIALTIDGVREQVTGQVVSGNYFELLGVRPALGRMLTASDESLDPPVAVVGHDLWKRRFGGTPDVLGKTFGYGDRTMTIVGVMPREFGGLTAGHPPDVMMPITLQGDLLQNADTWWLSAVVRRKPGVDERMAASEADRLFQGFLATHTSPEQRERFRWSLDLEPALRGDDGLRSQYARPLVLLMGLVSAVLLIACSNIASLLLARGVSRRRELAVRAAIGASRLRLVRQLLIESLLLSMVGTAAGLCVGVWGARAIASFFAEGRFPVLLDVGLDARVVLFAAGLCLLTTLFFGLAPAVRASRIDPNRDLRGRGGPAPAARGGLKASAGGALVVLQMVLSLVLLLCAGLFVRSLGDLRAVDLGFQPRGVLTVSVSPPGSEYPDERLARLWPSLLERIEALPGVRSASLSVLTPFSGRNRSRPMVVPGYQPSSDGDLSMHLNYISPEYFRTIGTPLARGRPFASQDAPDAPKVAMINQAAARFYFGDEDPIGRRVGFTPDDVEFEIVGVVEDARHNDLREAAPRFLYLPLAQSTQREGRLTLAVRTTGEPAALLPTLTREIRALDPGILVTDVATAGEMINHSILRDRLIARLSTAFGVFGLGLAALGLFGVISHAVAQRTREIGVRMALGAGAGRVRWEVMREGLWLSGIGAVVGALVGVVTLRTASSLLFGVSSADPATVLSSIGILVAVALAAAFLPARRATRTDPMVALRAE